MNDTTKKVLIGVATTALVGVAAYFTCKLALPSHKETVLGDPLPGTDKIEELIIVKEKKK